MNELVPARAEMIPYRRRKLLLFSRYFLSEDEARNELRAVTAAPGFDSVALYGDPSTIFLSLRTAPPPRRNAIPAPKPPVSYATCDPYQRYVYLNWLRDVSQPVPDEYVLLYYFGLERHLLYGDFDASFNEILFLRKHHSAPHMRSKSFLALLWGCEKRGRTDLVSSLLPRYEDHYYGINALVSFMYFLRLSLSPEMLFSLRPRFSCRVNTRYVHANANRYMDSLGSVLEGRFGRPELPVRDVVDISNVKQIEERAFANASIPREDRFVVYYDFRHDTALNGLLGEIYAAAHEKTKAVLRRGRYNTNKRIDRCSDVQANR